MLDNFKSYAHSKLVFHLVYFIYSTKFTVNTKQTERETGNAQALTQLSVKQEESYKKDNSAL